MFNKIFAVVAVAASLGMVSIPPSLASDKTTSAASESAPWWDTDYNAANSRANLTEKVLSPSVVTKIKYLRSVVSPVNPKFFCQVNVVAPVLVGGYLYVMANGYLSKYNAATGRLIWRMAPDPNFSQGGTYVSLAVSGNLVIVGAHDCQSASEPLGTVYTVNASTGTLVWASEPIGSESVDGAVVIGSYVVSAGSTPNGTNVSVFNLSNGNSVWGDFGCGNTFVPLVVGELVMTYGCNSTQSNAILEARTLASGAVVWSKPGAWKLQRGDLGGPTGKHLYATNPSGTVVDLNPQTGQTEYSLNGAVNILAVGSTRVYATCSSQGQYVCAYNISTGAREWQNTQPMVIGTTIAAEADGVLYTEFGAALNAATGQIIKQVWGVFTYSTVTALAVGDGRIAVVGDPRVLDLYGLKGY